MNVLLVDDQLEMRDLLREILISQGHTVNVAENADEAIMFLDRNDFDLVITDNDMPHGGKLTKNEGLRVIERAHQCPHQPYIMWMSGGAWGNAELLETVRTCGADEILLKPFDMSKFMQVVHRVSARKTLEVMPI